MPSPSGWLKIKNRLEKYNDRNESGRWDLFMVRKSY
jgi:hypothetical protein